MTHQPDDAAAAAMANIPEVSLEEASLLEEARANTGLDDFGDPIFQDGLRRLLDSLEREARLTAIGRLIAHGEVLRNLENRLRVTADWQRWPEMGEVAIEKPLFVVGLPRTGSTTLHDLFAQAPGNRVPLTWECHRPSPPPERASYDSDPRIAENQAYLDMTSGALIPEFKAIHPMGALLAQECVMLQAFDFMSIIFANQFRIPSYERWVEAVDLRPSYQTHRRQLQYMQWRCPGERWVLKSVGHLWGLEALFDIYPDARVVMTHRDPLKLIASHCSLVSMACSMGSDQVDDAEIGREWSQSWEGAMRQGISFRESGKVPPEQFFDMHFPEFIQDPVAMARRIYEHFGLDLSHDDETIMSGFLAENPPGKHGKHSYTLERFGLDRVVERERYRFYQEYYGVASDD
ncbi:MAG: sulfotransferase [Deltaproteobacteria bacterium]|nr:sulfotransferase [Deltaproteobacteria bacterium]